MYRVDSEVLLSRLSAIVVSGIFVIFIFFWPSASRAGDQVFYANDYASGSLTGGIQEAINACNQGYTSKGCVVRLPKGDTQVQSTIQIGGFTSTTAKEGIVLQGYGAGEYTSGGNASGGSNLLWNGSASGPIIDAQATNKLRIQDATLVMDAGLGSVASYGILLEGKYPGYPTTGVLLENLWIHGTGGSSTTVGVRIQGASGGIQDQVDRVSIRDVHMSSLSTCVEIASDQSGVNVIDGLNCGGPYKQLGVNVIAGAATITNSYFGSASSGALAGIQLSTNGVSGAESQTMQILNNWFETSSGSAILATTDGSLRAFATLVSGNNFLAMGSSLTVIHYTNSGAISLIGNTFAATGSYTSTLLFDSTLANQVFASGNQVSHQGTVAWSVMNGATLTCLNSNSNGPYVDANCNGTAGPGDGGINTSSNSANWGFTLWAADGTSGNAACQNRNLSCVDGYPAAISAAVGCQSTIATRIVLCK